MRKEYEELTKLLTEREEYLERNELSVRAFDNPNWAYKQAFNNGFRSAIGIAKKVILTLDQKEQNERNIILGRPTEETDLRATARKVQG